MQWISRRETINRISKKSWDFVPTAPSPFWSGQFPNFLRRSRLTALIKAKIVFKDAVNLCKYKYRYKMVLEDAVNLYKYKYKYKMVLEDAVNLYKYKYKMVLEDAVNLYK